MKNGKNFYLLWYVNQPPHILQLFLIIDKASSHIIWGKSTYCFEDSVLKNEK